MDERGCVESCAGVVEVGDVLLLLANFSLVSDRGVRLVDYL